jgi:hypothetical protein
MYGGPRLPRTANRPVLSVHSRLPLHCSLEHLIVRSWTDSACL